MALSSAQVKWISKNHRAFLDYQLTGKVPRTYWPDSPLIRLLESISPRDRLRICGVRLSPALGYSHTVRFHTAQQLLAWLKPRELIEGEPCPAETCRIKSFSNTLTLDDLKAHSASWPY